MTRDREVAAIKQLIDEGKIEYVKIGTRRWEVQAYEKVVTN